MVNTTKSERRIEAILRDPRTPQWELSVIRLALSVTPTDAAAVLNELADIFIDRLEEISRRELEERDEERKGCGR